VQRLAQFAKPAHLESRATDSMCDDIVSSIGAALLGLLSWGLGVARHPPPCRGLPAHDLGE
jgi:hypothetical protein